MTATQLCFAFNAQGPSQQIVPGQTDFGSAPYVDLLSIRPADVGSPGDEVVWIVHARIGDADLGGITNPNPRARFAIRLLDDTGATQRPCFMDLVGDNPLAPYKSAQHHGCITYATLHRAFATAAAGSQACLRVQLAFGWNLGQTLTRNLSIRVEDLTVVCWNLTRLAAAGIGTSWSASALATRLTGSAQNVGTAIGLLAPPSGTRTWLCYAAGFVDGGSATRSSFFDVKTTIGAVTTTLCGPTGTRSRSQAPQTDGIDWLYGAGLGVVQIAQGDPTGTLQMRAWDDYVTAGANEKHALFLGRQLFAVDVSSLSPVWSQTLDPSINPPSPAMYGAPPGNPNHGEQTTPRIAPTAVLGQHRVVHAWATPWQRHNPALIVRFASEIYVNGTANLPNSRQDPLYVIEDNFDDRLPDYQSTAFQTGRGPIFIEHLGYYSPTDDPLDAAGEPTRIVLTWGDPAARAFYGLSQCLVSFHAWIGVLEEPEDQEAIGPSVYIVPGREAVAPGSLPRLRYLPLEVASGEPVHRGVRMQTLDGRVLSWGLFLAPREIWRLTWRGTTAPHQTVLAWLRNLTNGMFAWEHPIRGDLRAWVISGASLQEKNFAPGIWEITVEAAELTWTGP